MNKEQRLQKSAQEMYNALQVILKRRKIFDFLYMNDQKALQMCGIAVDIFENVNNESWMKAAYNGKKVICPNPYAKKKRLKKN